LVLAISRHIKLSRSIKNLHPTV